MSNVSGVMNFDEWHADTRRGGAKFADWRDDGKIVFFIHPNSQIGKRVRVQARVPMEKDDGTEYIGSVYRHYLGRDDDITDKFLDWLADEDDIAAKDVVFRIQIGDEIEEYRKGDLLNLRGFDWQRQLLNPRTEYLLCIIPVDAPELLMLQLPKSAGKDLARLIKSQMDEYGEKGDPFKSPFAIKLSYDKGAKPADRYKAETHRAEPGPEHQVLFDAEPEDVAVLCDNNNDEQEKTMGELIRDMLVVPCSLLGVDEVEETEEDETTRRAAKEARKPKRQPQTRKAKPPQKKSDETSKKDVLKEAAKAKTKSVKMTEKTKPTKKKAVKPPPEPEPEETEEDPITCPVCERVVAEDDKFCPYDDCGVEFASDDDDDDDQVDVFQDDDGPIDNDDQIDLDDEIPF